MLIRAQKVIILLLKDGQTRQSSNTLEIHLFHTFKNLAKRFNYKLKKFEIYKSAKKSQVRCGKKVTYDISWKKSEGPIPIITVTDVSGQMKTMTYRSYVQITP